MDDDYYRFSNINFEFCSDGWSIPPSYNEQMNINTSIWKTQSGNDTSVDTFLYDNITTSIHGFFESKDGDSYSKTFNNVAPFNQLTISFTFWIVDIYGNDTSFIHFKVNDKIYHTFNITDSNCDETILWNDIEIDNSSILYGLIDNETLICIQGMHILSIFLDNIVVALISLFGLCVLCLFMIRMVYRD